MTMRIYAACLASYNNGCLHGRWIDADTDVAVMQAEVSAMLRESPFPNVTVTHPDTGEAVPSAEEYAIHDFDNMPSSLGEYSGLQAVADVVGLVEETRNEAAATLTWAFRCQRLAFDYMIGAPSFQDPRSEPECMTRPGSGHDQPHIRSRRRPVGLSAAVQNSACGGLGSGG